MTNTITEAIAAVVDDRIETAEPAVERRIGLTFGGFPCQPMFTSAGRRDGFRDPRGRLTMRWAEFQDLLAETDEPGLASVRRKHATHSPEPDPAI